MWRSVPISNEQRINLTGYRAAHAATVKPRENERFHGLSDFVYIRGPRNQNRPGFLPFRCATISLGFPRDFRLSLRIGTSFRLQKFSCRIVRFWEFQKFFLCELSEKNFGSLLVLFMSRFYDCSCFCIDYLFHFEFRYFEIILVTNIGFPSFISEINGSNSKKVREHCSLRVYPFEGFANVLVNEMWSTNSVWLWMVSVFILPPLQSGSKAEVLFDNNTKRTPINKIRGSMFSEIGSNVTRSGLLIK